MTLDENEMKQKMETIKSLMADFSKISSQFGAVEDVMHKAQNLQAKGVVPESFKQSIPQQEIAPFIPPTPTSNQLEAIEMVSGGNFRAPSNDKAPIVFYVNDKLFTWWREGGLENQATDQKENLSGTMTAIVQNIINYLENPNG
jgi:hypothetical protein